MQKDELVREIIKTFIGLKKTKVNYMTDCSDLKHNENLVLFIIKDESKDGRVLLSTLREKIKLAPSTVTPIITSLEESELIERNIDKEDRRNIYLSLSQKGIDYTNKAYDNLKQNITEYIEYMGEDDSRELVRLISKTTEYMKERKNK